METRDRPDDLGLRTSLADLAGLVTEGKSLDENLTRIATFAAGAVPNADGAGVSLVRPTANGHQLDAAAVSHAFVGEIDRIQHVTLDEGPGVTAALESRTVRSGSLDGDSQWPRFGPRVGRLGVHSVLSLPLVLPERSVGAINVYARRKDAFDDRAVEHGELFAAPAAVAVHNAQVLARALELTQQLQIALESRPIVDQAIGLLRGRSGLSVEAAMDELRALSRDDGRKLVDVARDLLDEAVAAARARSGPT
jgi:GAF domain-containing protein